jgi:hypothetical protein
MLRDQVARNVCRELCASSLLEWSRPQLSLHPRDIVPAIELPPDVPEDANRVKSHLACMPTLASFGSVMPANAVQYPFAIRSSNNRRYSALPMPRR